MSVLPPVRLPLKEELNDLAVQFARTGFVEVRDVLPRRYLPNLVADHVAGLRSCASRLDAPTRTGPSGRPILGTRMGRIDPEIADRTDSARGLAQAEILEQAGLRAFGVQAAGAVSSFLEQVTGRPRTFDRVVVLVYEPFDAIPLHNDADVGDRYNVQFPIPILCLGGIRIFDVDRMRTFPDRAGDMRVLGPAVWHDVPPVWPKDASGRSVRINISLRFR